ncbi:uncharacterized transmembrane protein DDB_G0289901-like isoform X2 [Mercenaria mercenaria]|uniref:uncharacterized transmembrane protein DDB_G0289901-like isoform X2 n=1 Tax=Mercenaria mercenaria TaxID=6596 RepID=UPI00234EFFF6|nr:uncharacterized transmembrane protein DDB_G0289901-like isoform X2 [Mercenaria mercenaria]
MKTKMEKLVIALFGIVFLSVLSDAQDIGRIRRLMLLRQRELALRRAAFPFGVRGIGGPGIPPPVAARLALIQRQRGGSGNIFGQQPTQVFPNVPDVVQIPSVTPTAQGQPGGGQTGLTQAGAGQMGGQMNVQTGGQAGGQIGAGQFGGQATGSMGGSMTGTMGGPTGGPMGGPVSGPIGGTMGGPISGPIGGSMGGPMGGPVSGQMGGSMGGPMGGRVSGQMGGSMGGPMGGRVSGPMGGSMGGPMGGRVSGPMRGSMGGPMGGPISGPIGGTMSRPMGGSAVGQFGGQMGGPFGRQVSGPFGGRMTGPTFSFGQPSSGQFSAGTQTQGGQGSAIFPSQATQGPIIRQRGPGFTPDSSFSTGLDLSGSSTVVPGFPNGPALQFPDGARAFGQSDQLLFPRGGFSPEALSTTGLQSSGFQGFPRGSFGQSFGGAATGGQGFRPATFGPSFAATPTSGQIISQTSGGSEGQSQATSNFGFVRPSDSAAGPAFNTGTQPRQNFNIQFQPLQPGPQVPQIPEQQPTQGQMGLGTSGQANTGLNNGFSSQGNIQFGSSGQVGGSSQSGLQFGGSGQTGIQTGGTDQNSKFTNSGSTTVVETNTEQQSGTISFGSNRQGSNSAATTISERTVEAMAPVGNAEASTEFRLVEVGNILGDKGFVNNDATSGSAVAIETTSGQQGSAFQPAGDITTAFRSFEAVDGSQNFVDLSLEPTVTMTTAGSTVSKTDTTGSVTVTNTSETKTVMSVQDGPFARSINQDFSFFMDESNQAPNEMPPITFNAPEPPAVGSGGTQVLTFPVQGTGSTGAATSNTSQGFSLSTNSVTSGKTVTGPVQPDTTTIASDTTVGGLL